MKKIHKAIFTFGVVLAMFVMIAIPNVDNAQATNHNELSEYDLFFIVRDDNPNRLFTVSDQYSLTKLKSFVEGVKIGFDSSLFNGCLLTIDNYYNQQLSLVSVSRDVTVNFEHNTRMISGDYGWDGTITLPSDPVVHTNLPNQLKAFHVGDPNSVIIVDPEKYIMNVYIGDTGNADVYVLNRDGTIIKLEECLAENGWMPVVGDFGCSNTGDGFTNINTYILGDFVLTVQGNTLDPSKSLSYNDIEKLHCTDNS